MDRQEQAGKFWGAEVGESTPRTPRQVHVGFASPCDEYIEARIDLNKELIKHPTATFYAELLDDSMFPLIHSGSKLIIDKMVTPAKGDVVMAIVNGEACVRRFCINEDKTVWLKSENENYQPIYLVPGIEFQIWGCVIHFFLTLKKI
jgi:DNA polymerase V